MLKGIGQKRALECIVRSLVEYGRRDVCRTEENPEDSSADQSYDEGGHRRGVLYAIEKLRDAHACRCRHRLERTANAQNRDERSCLLD